MTLLYCDEVSCKSQVLNHKYPARMIRCSAALDASDCFDCNLASVCSHQLSYYSVLVACANVVGPCFRLSEIEGGGSFDLRSDKVVQTAVSSQYSIKVSAVVAVRCIPTALID